MNMLTSLLAISTNAAPKQYYENDVSIQPQIDITMQSQQGIHRHQTPPRQRNAQPC